MDHFSIAPQLLEIIIMPGLRVKNVDDDVKVIHTYPFGMLSPLHMGRTEVQFCSEPTLDILGNSSDLGSRITFADDEIISRRVIYGFEVEKNDFFSFDICDAVYDQIRETIADCFRLDGFFRAYQMFMFLVKRINLENPCRFLVSFLLPYFASGVIEFKSKIIVSQKIKFPRVKSKALLRQIMEDLRIYETLDSTNKESYRLLASGQKLHGTAILTLHQTEGRGQYGRTWFSQPGNHLAISIILQPTHMPLEDLPLLSLKTSIAVVRSLMSLDQELNPRIKWPNDIYIGDLKLAGILIENSISSSKVQHSIIGVGMNVNELEFPSDLPNPVSLFMLTGRKFELIPLGEKLREEMMKVLDEPIEKWKSEYDRLIYGLGKQNNFELAGKNVSAKIVAVGNDGKLSLEMDGQRKSYFSHEIKWLK